jgi:hypothetical protein
MGNAHSNFKSITVTYNPIYTVDSNEDKQVRLENKLNMHENLNQLLKDNGFPIESKSLDAIKSAYKHGLIDKTIKTICCSINKNAP